MIAGLAYLGIANWIGLHTPDYAVESMCIGVIGLGFVQALVGFWEGFVKITGRRLGRSEIVIWTIIVAMAMPHLRHQLPFSNAFDGLYEGTDHDTIRFWVLAF